MTALIILQKSLYKILKVNAPKDIEERIYSHLPEEVIYPYIRIAELQAKEYQTNTDIWLECTSLIEVCSNATSNYECLKILEHINLIFQQLHSNKIQDFPLIEAKIRKQSITQKILPQNIWYGTIELFTLTHSGNFF